MCNHPGQTTVFSALSLQQVPYASDKIFFWKEVGFSVQLNLPCFSCNTSHPETEWHSSALWSQHSRGSGETGIQFCCYLVWLVSSAETSNLWVSLVCFHIVSGLMNSSYQLKFTVLKKALKVCSSSAAWVACAVCATVDLGAAAIRSGAKLGSAIAPMYGNALHQVWWSNVVRSRNKEQ